MSDRHRARKFRENEGGRAIGDEFAVFECRLRHGRQIWSAQVIGRKIEFDGFGSFEAVYDSVLRYLGQNLDKA